MKLPIMNYGNNLSQDLGYECSIVELVSRCYFCFVSVCTVKNDTEANCGIKFEFSSVKLLDSSLLYMEFDRGESK